VENTKLIGEAEISGLSMNGGGIRQAWFGLEFKGKEIG